MGDLEKDYSNRASNIARLTIENKFKTFQDCCQLYRKGEGFEVENSRDRQDLSRYLLKEWNQIIRLVIQYIKEGSLERIYWTDLSTIARIQGYPPAEKLGYKEPLPGSSVMEPRKTQLLRYYREISEMRCPPKLK